MASVNIGDEFKSNNYGDFKVIGYEYKIGKDKNKRKYYICEFIESGFKTGALSNNIKNGHIVDKSEKEIGINNVLDSNNYGKFKITQIDKVSQKVLCEFVETNYEIWTSRGNALAGRVKDRLSKSICGVACHGLIDDYDMDIYKRWNSMIRRCYKGDSSNYKFYGLLGVTVCERWLNFSNFYNDYKKIIGWDYELFKNGEIELDKDLNNQYSNKNNKEYSLDNCAWIHQGYNKSLITSKSVFFKATYNELVYYGYNIAVFCRKYNLDHRVVSAYVSNEIKKDCYKGWKFKKITKEEFLTKQN